MKEIRTYLLGMAAMLSLGASAQSVTLKGIGHNNRYDDGDQMKSEYLGWNSELAKSIFIVDNGIYSMTWDSSSLSTPTREPVVDKDEVLADNEKSLWATNFNLMYGNSGAAYVNGKLITIMSRDEQSTTDENLFNVRTWDAKTGDLLSSEVYPKSALLESAGMSYNPKDGKVYGLFYLTGRDLPAEITEDPEFFTDEDDDMTDGDAGYAICTIDFTTMTVTPITPGLYYYNFITFAINSEGRAFALTSGGDRGYEDEDGRMRDIDNKLTGAQLCEFDLETGLMKTRVVSNFDVETGEESFEYVSIYDGGTGYCSQYKRQAACFANSNPNKMYWVGYYNSGKGVNDYGSWSTLSDKEWRTNGKYDTALYEVDITTGVATRLSKVDNRWIFSALWVDGDDPSDNAGEDIITHKDAYLALQQADNGSILQPVEIGKRYTYIIEPASGWTIHSVTFDGGELTVGEDGSVTTPVISGLLSRLIVTFEMATSTDAPADAVRSNVKVLATANGLHITGATAGEQVSVYSTDGKMLLSQTIKSHQADITLSPGQLYIVKVGEKVVKVSL